MIYPDQRSARRCRCRSFKTTGAKAGRRLFGQGRRRKAALPHITKPRLAATGAQTEM